MSRVLSFFTKHSRLILLVVLVIAFNDARADGWKIGNWLVDPVLMYSHTSSIIHGCPLNCGEDELTLDYYSAGFTFSSPKNTWQVDLTQGYKHFNCNEPVCRETGTQVQVRWYPFR